MFAANIGVVEGRVVISMDTERRFNLGWDLYVPDMYLSATSFLTFLHLLAFKQDHGVVNVLIRHERLAIYRYNDGSVDFMMYSEHFTKFIRPRDAINLSAKEIQYMLCNKEQLLVRMTVCSPPPLPTMCENLTLWHKVKENTLFMNQDDRLSSESFGDCTLSAECDGLIKGKCKRHDNCADGEDCNNIGHYGYVAIVYIKATKLLLCRRAHYEKKGVQTVLRVLDFAYPHMNALCYLLAAHLPANVKGDYEQYIKNSQFYVENEGIVVRINKIGVIIRKNRSVSFLKYTHKNRLLSGTKEYPKYIITWSAIQAQRLLKWYGSIVTPICWIDQRADYIKIWKTTMSPAQYMGSESIQWPPDDYYEQLHSEHDSDEAFDETISLN